MANTKISALTNGNPAQSGDQLPIARGGANFSVTAGSIAALAGGTGSLSGSISSQHNSPATTPVNVTTEGTYDWAIVSPSGINGSDYVSNYLRWKANRGMLARNGVRKVVSTANVTASSAGGGTGGGWVITANAGDEYADALDNLSGHGIPESGSSAWDGVADISGGGQTGFGFQFFADSTSQSRTINLYLGARTGVGSGTITVTAHLTDGSAPDVTETFNVNVTGTNMWFKTSFTFQSQSSCRLVVNAIAATSTGGANIQVFFTGMTES